MGLDLTVNLHSSTETIESFTKVLNIFNSIEASNLPDKEEFSLSAGDISKYYRLNWTGVREEGKFSYGILGFLSNKVSERNQAKITLKQLKTLKECPILVKGIKKTKWGNEIVEKIVSSKSIAKANGNVIKLKHLNATGRGQNKDRYWGPTYVSQYSLYNLSALPFNKHFYSALHLISMGSWTGSNGEEYTIKHNIDGGLDVFTDEYESEESENTIQKLVKHINAYDFERLKVYIQLNIDALENLITNDPEDKNDWKYIASNNLTLLKILQAFSFHQDLEFISYFG